MENDNEFKREYFGRPSKMNLDGFVEGTIICPACASFDCNMEHSRIGEVAVCLDCRSVFPVVERVLYKTRMPETKDDIERCNAAIRELEGASYDDLEVARKPEPPISLEDYKLEKFRNWNREQLRQKGYLKNED